MEKCFDVVGIGNAIVDVLVQADDRFLEEHDLTRVPRGNHNNRGRISP